jgi:group II intron reverse transcriptase/maturase
VYKAVRAGDRRRARSLQKLILKSTSARLLAIRQVTQLNAGKRTAGVDGKSSLTFKERFALSDQLRRDVNNWRHQGLREIPIPKKNGKIRLLKVPTMADRAWQCLAKYALEPAHEATFHARSYGFRPGRSAHDAQKYLCLNLSRRVDGIKKRVIELDIEKCFDRISHRTIMTRLIAPSSLKLGIFRCLKAGVDAAFPDQGTPQGGVVSPLLANVALNGIEDIHRSVRYADDMVFFLKPQDDTDAVLERVRHFLADRGMNISAEKTRVTASTDGFDFLGWHFQVQANGKFRSKPSVENFKSFRQKVKHIVNHSNYGAKVKASKLAPIVRGWRNYHRHCKMRGNRHSLSAMRRRTYKVFNREPKQNRYTSSQLLARAFPAVPVSENRHINVKETKSPFDGDIAYWSERNSKHYSGTTLRILRKQGHRCGRCHLNLLSSEKVELHHIDGNHNNWKGNNLLAVHQSCHRYIHMSKSDS